MAKTADQSYLGRVKCYQNRYPALKQLIDFTKTPAWYETRLTVLEFRPTSVSEKKIGNVQELEGYWAGQADMGDECKGRLYLLEDLSAPYIEALGGHFNIDPSFFVRHLYLPFWSKDEADQMLRRLPPRLISTNRLNPASYSLRYYELRSVLTQVGQKNCRRMTCANVKRRVLRLEAEHESKFEVILRNASFWIPRPGSTCWNALIIVDPPFGDKLLIRDMENSTATDTTTHCNSTAYLQDYINFSPWPDNPTAQSLEDLSGPSRRSIFDDIIFLWKHASSPDDIAMAISDPHSSAVFAKRAIASSWLVYLEFVTGTTSQLETRLWAFESMKYEQPSDADKREIAVLRGLLKSVNRWRRRTWWYIDHMRWNLEALRQSMSEKKGSPEDFAWNGDHTIEDFAALYQRLQYCKDKIESLMPVVMGAFSLLEAQQRAMETKHLTFLTTLATIFLPLSFSTSLFSMSGDYSPGERHFGIFWAVSLPLVALVFASVYVVKYTQSGRWQLSL